MKEIGKGNNLRITIALVGILYMANSSLYASDIVHLRKPLSSNLKLDKDRAANFNEQIISNSFAAQDRLNKKLKEIISMETNYDNLIPNWISRLEVLNFIEVLKGNLLYFSWGNDYFPSYFTMTFGLNVKNGIGVTVKNMQLLEKEAIGRGLPKMYWNMKKKYKVFTRNNFSYKSYFPKIKKAGGVDVLLIKGLTAWAEHHKAFPDAELFKWSKSAQKTEFEKRLNSSIKDLIKKTSEELLKSGGFIIVAHERDDLLLSDFIMKELGYLDYLAQPTFKKVRDVLSTGKSIQSRFYDDVALVLGKVPIRVFQKPHSFNLKEKVHSVVIPVNL
ncbi:MAG: hypothetical protein P9L93_02520 [Candidatus Gorgyraea atricola]|nr:hypothetical protein [Candidatus Gorgyraea atricola]